MAALTANILTNHFPDQELAELQVGAGARIYAGSLLGYNASGYVGPYGASGYTLAFAGVAYDAANNTSGSNGDTAILDSSGNRTKEGKVKAYIAADFEFTVTATLAIINQGFPLTAVSDNPLDMVLGASAGANLNAADVGRIIYVTSAASPYKARVRLRGGAFIKA